MNPWKVVAAAVRGPDHEEDGSPCQDAFAHRLDGKRLIAAVADGAGSAAHSHEGARRLCDVVVGELAKCGLGLPNGAGEADPVVEDWSDRACTAVQMVRDELRYRIAQTPETEEAASLRDYAATLVAVVAEPEGGFFLHIGDGAAAALADLDAWSESILSKPENGEFANETYFFTGDDWRERLRFTCFGPSELIVLLSDGAMPFTLADKMAGLEPRFMAPVTSFPRRRRRGDRRTGARQHSRPRGCPAHIRRRQDAGLDPPPGTDAMTEHFIARVPGSAPRRLKLGKVIHKGGGAGRIVAVSGDPSVVAKLYHDPRTAAPYEAKIAAMLERPPALPPIENGSQRFEQIAWPRAIVEDDGGTFRGFIMPFIDPEPGGPAGNASGQGAPPPSRSARKLRLSPLRRPERGRGGRRAAPARPPHHRSQAAEPVDLQALHVCGGGRLRWPLDRRRQRHPLPRRPVHRRLPGAGDGKRRARSGRARRRPGTASRSAGHPVPAHEQRHPSLPGRAPPSQATRSAPNRSASTPASTPMAPGRTAARPPRPAVFTTTSKRKPANSSGARSPPATGPPPANGAITCAA